MIPSGVYSHQACEESRPGDYCTSNIIFPLQVWIQVLSQLGNFSPSLIFISAPVIGYKFPSPPFLGFLSLHLSSFIICSSEGRESCFFHFLREGAPHSELSCIIQYLFNMVFIISSVSRIFPSRYSSSFVSIYSTNLEYVAALYSLNRLRIRSSIDYPLTFQPSCEFLTCKFKSSIYVIKYLPCMCLETINQLGTDILFLLYRRWLFPSKF